MQQQQRGGVYIMQQQKQKRGVENTIFVFEYKITLS